MNIAGVDPGFSGAIAIITHDAARVYDMPVIKTEKQELDMNEIMNILTCADHVYIEKSQSMPGQGISSTGRYMMGYGAIIGICVGLGKPYSLVHPKTWKKTTMRDMGKEKEASIVRAKQLFPALDLHRKKDHGRADALLIAYHGLHHG